LVKRFAFNVVSSLSLLLFIVAMTLWIRSYWVGDYLHWVDANSHPNDALYRQSYMAASAKGGIQIQSTYEAWGAFAGTLNVGIRYGWLQRAPESYPRYTPVYSGAPNFVRTFTFAGFQIVLPIKAFSQSGYFERTVSITVPIPAIVVITALMPFRRLRLYLRQRKPGHCPRCGYDLRATPDRCPECGYIAKPKSPQDTPPQPKYIPSP
jgi:hypothetical protein